MKQAMKPVVNIYMRDMAEARMLAAMLYRNGDGVFYEVPDNASWEQGVLAIEVALPHKKYMIYRGERE